MCVCVCVCVCEEARWRQSVRERRRGWEKERERERKENQPLETKNSSSRVEMKRWRKWLHPFFLSIFFLLKIPSIFTFTLHLVIYSKID